MGELIKLRQEEPMSDDGEIRALQERVGALEKLLNKQDTQIEFLRRQNSSRLLGGIMILGSMVTGLLTYIWFNMKHPT